MNSINQSSRLDTLDMKVKLSTLWIFALFNIAFADIHEILRPGFLAEVMTGTIDGIQMTAGFLLLANIMTEIPIIMVLLSRVLPYGLNRWANIIAGIAGIGSVIGTFSTDPDRIFVGTIVTVSMLLIIWYAWRWPNPERNPDNRVSVDPVPESL